MIGTYSELAEGVTSFRSANDVFLFGGLVYRVSFVILAGVMIAQSIVEEFKTGTVKALFTYPIYRKKMIAAKLLIVFAVTTLGYFVCKMVYISSMIWIIPLLHLLPIELTADMILPELPVAALEALAVGGMGFIALYFGMKKKSPTHAIIVACVIGAALITCRNINRVDI